MLASHGSRFARPPPRSASVLLALQERAKGTGMPEMESKIKSEIKKEPLRAQVSSHDDTICVVMLSSDSEDEKVSDLRVFNVLQ